MDKENTNHDTKNPNNKAPTPELMPKEDQPDAKAGSEPNNSMSPDQISQIVMTVASALFQMWKEKEDNDRKFSLKLFNHVYWLAVGMIVGIGTLSFWMMQGRHFDEGYSLLTHTLAIVGGALTVASALKPPSE